MERKLASIQRVLAIEPIPNADAIELVKINGWACVVKKTEFAVGDLGVFFEIDAIPPDIEVFRFLWTPKTAAPGELVERPAKFRIRTMRLRGALSQGLFLPLATLELDGAEEGEDVTQRLGVEKYEPPVSLSMGGLARGPFPSWLPKTDEMRVQSVPEVLDELRGLPYLCTLKCDGTSATFTRSPFDGEFHVCSRNLSLVDGDNVYWNLARRLDLALVTESGLSIQGEVCGPGIQKNRLNLKAPALLVFNVYDAAQSRYLNDSQMREFCARYGLTPVEVVEAGEGFSHSQESLLSLAEGFYPQTKNEREGVVIRPQEERYSQVLNGRLSFKAISNRFLLKEGE
jgi:RNA ligase (TIGR02306 family)